MKKYSSMSLLLALITLITLSFTACSSSDDDDKDLTPPVIYTENDGLAGYLPNPVNCQVYKRGSEIPFSYLFTDDVELGNYNIEIHNNFDHHTHSTTSASDCEEDEHEHEHTTAQNPWVFNQDYAIPAGQQRFEARQTIAIPEDIDEGDYHFMVRVTDRAGWQTLHAVAIKIED